MAAAMRPQRLIERLPAVRGRLTENAPLAGMIADLAEPGDLVVCLGAGSITNWAHALPEELSKLYAARKSQ